MLSPQGKNNNIKPEKKSTSPTENVKIVNNQEIKKKPLQDNNQYMPVNDKVIEKISEKNKNIEFVP